MRRIPSLIGQVFGYLTAVETTGPGHRYKCLCKCGKSVVVSASNLNTGHTQSCGCYNKERLTEAHTGNKYCVGKPPSNKIDRTGKRYGKLVALKDEGNGRWLCQCDCGNLSSVLSTNLSNMAKNDRGCRLCGTVTVDITGERRGMIVAIKIFKGSHKPPKWIFKCDCGTELVGSVQEFHQNRIWSCGCIGNAYASWQSMLARCYNPNSNRYYCYGERGITVCDRWRGDNGFENFLSDMGERPLGYNLSRKYAEGNYEPSNCIWERMEDNTSDTMNGTPTRAGILKGAEPRLKRN